MNMTRSQLAALLTRNPQISLSPDETALEPRLPDPKCQLDPLPPLERGAQSQTSSLERTRVRFTSHRCRSIDNDNLVAGCKGLLDGLVASGLLPGDGPDQLIAEYHQQKVAHRSQECTLVEIFYPDEPGVDY